MPKFFQDKVAGYYLYYTKHCVMECLHAHASDRKLTESGSAKFFVRSDGSSYVQHVDVFDQGFPEKEKLKLPGQIFG